MESAPWGLVAVRPIVAREGGGDRGVSAIAAEQHSLITVPQLAYVGLDRNAVRHRTGEGRLHRIHRGVYAVGHGAIAQISFLAAGVLASGAGSVLSHWSAAALWKLLPFIEGRVHVSSAGRNRRSRNGLAVHRPHELPRREFVVRELIPVTSPARTVVDVADAGGDFESAINEGRALHRFGDSQLRRAVESSPNRIGAKRLAAFLDAEQSPGFSRSKAETILRELIEAARLPPAHRNVRAHGYELDFYWPDLRLNVETDGSTTHTRERNFESDRARDADLATHGVQVLRFTWKQLTREPMVVIARLAAAMAVR